MPWQRRKKLIEKTVSNIREVKARGAMVILICDNSIEVGEGVADYIIRLPQTDEQLMRWQRQLRYS